jgi:hypothetical protein
VQLCLVVAVLATVRDPDGRLVGELDERWAHILARHSKLRMLQSEIRRAVARPTARRAGRERNEIWHFLADVGPSRWLKVVVIYKGERPSPVRGR